MIIESVEVYAEFIAAVKRTGLTSALDKAKDRLPILLKMKPKTVEMFCKGLIARGEAD